MRDIAPRRVRLSSTAVRRRWILVNLVLAVLTLCYGFASRDLARYETFLRQSGGDLSLMAHRYGYWVLGAVFLALLPLSLLLATEYALLRQQRLLREGIPVTATVTDRQGVVLASTPSFAIRYEAALSGPEEETRVIGAMPVSPSEVQRLSLGAPLTLLVNPDAPNDHLPYHAIRDVHIEGAPLRA